MCGDRMKSACSLFVLGELAPKGGLTMDLSWFVDDCSDRLDRWREPDDLGPAQGYALGDRFSLRSYETIASLAAT